MQHPTPPRPSGLTRADARRLDGKLENALTGAGVAGVDAGSSTSRRLVTYGPAYARLEYRQSWAARREIDRPARDLVSGGFELQDLPPGFDGPAIVSALTDVGTSDVPEDRGALAALSRLHAEGHKLGGAALVSVLDDDLETWEPVDLGRIRRVVSLELLERDEITAWRSSAGGPVEYYIIGTARTELTPSSIVHASRVILCKGARLSPSEEWANHGWGASTLEILHTERTSMHTAHQEMGTLILRGTMDAIYIAELAEQLCGGEDGDAGTAKATIEERLTLISRARGQHRLIPLDGGRSQLGEDEPARPSEKIESIGRPVEGVAKLAAMVENAWAAGTGQTPSIALGRNVGGLNTGENAGDWQSWSSVNDGERCDWLIPRLDRLIELVCASREGPTGGRVPETWCVKMAPLWVPPPLEVAQVRKLQAEADEIYAGIAGLASDEIREQRQVLGATGELRLEPLPVVEVDPLLVAGTDDASKQALNGAQIKALFELSANVSAQVIPIETALWLVTLAIPGIDEASARAALTAASNVEPREMAAAVEPVAAVPVELAQTVADAFTAQRAASSRWWRRDAKPTPAAALESWRRAWA